MRVLAPSEDRSTSAERAIDVTDLESYLRDLGEPAPGGRGAENRLVLSRVDSTNRLARSVVSCYRDEEMLPPGLLVLALGQSAGRGRHGRTWVSPPGAGVYGTRVLPVASTRQLGTVPLLAASGLALAVGELDGKRRCRLKWPNDLMLGGRKVGGVLVEAMARPEGGATALVGFGVNVLPADTRAGPDTTASAAVPGSTSLAEQLDGPLPPLGRVARRLTEGLESALERVGDPAHAIESFRALTVHRPGDLLRFRIGDRVIEGELVGFDEQGHVRMRRQDGGELLISSGELVENRDA